MDARDTAQAEAERLLAEVRAGAAGARDRLFAHFRAFLSRFVELRLDARLRSRLDASDVVQEAQMEASRRLDAYLAQDAAVPFHLWLRQIALDRVVMAHRQHAGAARRSVKRDLALPDRSSELLARSLWAGGPTPSEQMTQAERAERVRQALERLSEADREVLVMRHLEGLTNQEVALALGLETSAASQRYGRALFRLRAVLQEGESA